MKMRRCQYCGSEIDPKDITCPFCGGHVGAEEAAPSESKAPSVSSVNTIRDSASWLPEWRRKVVVGKLSLALFVLAIMMIPCIPLFGLLQTEPTKEVCEYSFNFAPFGSVNRDKTCSIQPNPEFAASLTMAIFLFVLFAFLVFFFTFAVKLQVKKIGGSTVAVYRGPLKYQLIIDGEIADSIGPLYFRRNIMLTGKVATGEKITACIPYTFFFKTDFILGGEQL